MSNVGDVKQQDTMSKSIKTLEMMLDYAIIEGAELKLPMFVWLLRLAKLELMDNAEGDQRRIEIMP